LACHSYPDCRNTKEFAREEDGKIKIVEDEECGETCDKCGKKMVIKRGRFGVFIACSGYPDCKNTKAMTTGVACPEENCKGDIAVRYSRKGKIFYSCSRYPKCKYAIWDKPVAEKCPQCDAPFLTEKAMKKAGTILICPQCKYKRNIEDSS